MLWRAIRRCLLIRRSSSRFTLFRGVVGAKWEQIREQQTLPSSTRSRGRSGLKRGESRSGGTYHVPVSGRHDNGHFPVFLARGAHRDLDVLAKVGQKLHEALDRKHPRPVAHQRGDVRLVIGSIRRECLDHVLVLGERHLRRTLTRYFAYYHEARTHLSLDKDAPDGRSVERPERGRVISIREVGGLHHRYVRRAA